MSWKKIKLKYLANMRSGDSITSDSIDGEGCYPVYGGGALRGYTESFTHEGNYILIGRQGANCGSVRQVNGKFFASEHAVVVSHNSDVDNEWLYYLLESMNLNQYSISAAQPGLAVSTIKNLEVNVPSYDLQIVTRKYINKKTKIFEAIIKQKENLIELLEQQRQSIITEAVTKGLNPNVKMKDSGVEWIGEIPEHWEVTKIKYTTYVKGRIGWQGLKSDEFIDEGPFLVTGTDFTQGFVNWDTCYHISEERYNEAPPIQLQENDLLITKDGTIGKLAIVKEMPYKAILNSGVFVTRPFHNKYLSKYMYWLLSSTIFDKYIKFMETGSTIKHLYQETFVNFSYPIPTIVEQTEILNYLDIKIGEIDSIKSNLVKQIEKLKEYRQSLIYEAVTGKIDVRDIELDEVR
ncbi:MULTISPECIES: restriction endonuclease subunit S [Bacillus amyloliquefaciens group]|uniref:restriction endonuclease subunit S n=1 Tax=Bacillus amyloliquefaciens group TaxID=1938374 RepID=UPI000B51A929|nr:MULTISPECIES: restriction endonuclease subunit S [Bacillus amyloliquefaciens group]ASF27974.1 restriction endonuclease subunit S [Bacillus amyloliquefaciens]MDQ8094031.1 restriction endonuclease subunit S [Bacillus amyloliquefaciens]